MDRRLASNDMMRQARSVSRPPAHGGPKPDVVAVDTLCIDMTRRHVALGSREIRLTPLEYRLLTLLALQDGRVVTHRCLLDHLWGSPTTATVRMLHVLVSRLRRKVEPRPALPRYVVTAASIGYRFAARNRQP